MGVDTLAVFRDGVNLALGDKGQANERLDVWINRAIEELFVRLDIEGRRIRSAVIPTVVGQQAYVLPVDLVGVLSVVDSTNNRRVLRTTIENFGGLNATRTGRPHVYARVDRDLFINPLPNSIVDLQIVYVKAPARLVAANDVTELISAYDQVVHLLATKNAMFDLGMDERATLRFQAAENLIRTIPTEEWLEAQAQSVPITVARTEDDLRR